MSEEFTENFDFITEAPPQVDTFAAIKAAAALAIERKIKANLKSGKEVPESWGKLVPQAVPAKKPELEIKQEAVQKAVQKLAEIKQAKIQQEKLECEREMANLDLQISEFEEHLKIALERKTILTEKLKSFDSVAGA